MHIFSFVVMRRLVRCIHVFRRRPSAEKVVDGPPPRTMTEKEWGEFSQQT